MIKPLHDNVVLKKDPVDKEKKSAGGIILTENKENTPSMARVVAKGEKCEADFGVGDQVVYKEYSGTKVTVDDEEYIILEEEDVLAVVEGGE